MVGAGKLARVPANPSPPNPSHGKNSVLREIAAYFIRLGFTAFGGPAAHIALMEEQLVQRRKWLDRTHFLDLIALINFLPGPNSTELAIALGRLRGGWRGLIIAGTCFIVPAVLIILPIAWLYVNYGHLPHVLGILRGISAAIVAIMATAVVRLARTVLRDPFTLLVTIAAAIGEFFVHRHRLPLGDLAILAAAALVGMFRAGNGLKPAIRSIAAAPAAGGLSAIIAAAASVGTLAGPIVMTLLFLQIGATLFGSGYVLVTYLQSLFVDHRHWLTQQQMLDAVAVGQITPGPLLTTATFVGFLLGHNQFGGGLAMEIACALAATAAIFAPSFLFVGLLGNRLEKLRSSAGARGALDGMNAAVVGLIGMTCLFLGQQALMPPTSGVCAAILLISAGLLLMTRINSSWVILAAGVAGFFLLGLTGRG
jgi:chromate transporter